MVLIWRRVARAGFKSAIESVAKFVKAKLQMVLFSALNLQFAFKLISPLLLKLITFTEEI